MRTIRDPPVVLDWQRLLVDAVSKPGIISSAYTAFHTFSFGNMLLAHFQCVQRGIRVGPIHTFAGWLKHDRHVRRGEKALTLVMPVTVKRKRLTAETTQSHEEDQPDGNASFTRFIERPFWFTLAQTDGRPYAPLSIPHWNQERALDVLGITLESFELINGNAQGYAYGRTVSVSPLAFQPHRTLFHELAHVLLGHTAETRSLSDDDATTPRDLQEVEAECVALLCSASLDLPGQEFSRGYIQSWLKSDAISERSVQRIFKAADALLKAGVPPVPAAGAEAPTA